MREGALFAFRCQGRIAAWLAHFRSVGRVEPLIVTVHHAQRPVMLIPLGIERRLVFLGGSVTEDYASILAPGREALRERAKRLPWLRNALRRLRGRKPLPG